jgi:hypothetical protein
MFSTLVVNFSRFILSELLSFKNQNWQMKYFILFHFSLWKNDFYQALISTSTPEGKSSLLNASTVLEEEV